MASNLFSADGTWVTGLDAVPNTLRCLRYSGSLGGGTLRVRTVDEGVTSNIPAATLNASTLDDDGNTMTQLVLRSQGAIEVVLTGSTTPSVTVTVK